MKKITKKEKLKKVREQLDELVGDKEYQKIKDIERVLLKIKDGIDNNKPISNKKELVELKQKISELIDNSKDFNDKIFSCVKEEVVGEIKKIEIPNPEKRLIEIRNKLENIVNYNKGLEILVNKMDFRDKIDQLIIDIKAIKEDYKKILEEVIGREVSRIVNSIKVLTKIVKKDRYSDVLKEISGKMSNLIDEFSNLRETIGSKVTGSGVEKITVDNEEPKDPEIGDLWVDTGR